MLSESQKTELQQHKETVARLEREIDERVRHQQALYKIIQGLQELDNLPSGHPDQIALIDESNPAKSISPKAAPEAPDGEASRNFSRALLALIAENEGRRGVSFDTVVAAAKDAGLTTLAQTYEAGVRYAINGLKKQGLVRSPKRGFYKVVPPKKNGEAG